MKKKNVLLLCLVVSGIVNAQKWIDPGRESFQPYHDIRFGIGCKPFEAANFTFGDDIFELYNYQNIIDFNAKDYYSGARYTTNALFCEYIYQANRWFGVGATLTYFAYYNSYYDAETNEHIGMNLVQHVSLYPTVRLTWYNKPGFSMYSAFGIGGRSVFSTDNLRSNSSNSFRNNIACQVTLFGFTIGKNIYAFSDVCTIGTQGVLTGGIGYRIASHRK